MEEGNTPLPDRRGYIKDEMLEWYKFPDKKTIDYLNRYFPIIVAKQDKRRVRKEAWNFKKIKQREQPLPEVVEAVLEVSPPEESAEESTPSLL